MQTANRTTYGGISRVSSRGIGKRIIRTNYHQLQRRGRFHNFYLSLLTSSRRRCNGNNKRTHVA
eukprot:4060857-Amphidinium_carterae.1